MSHNSNSNSIDNSDNNNSTTINNLIYKCFLCQNKLIVMSNLSDGYYCKYCERYSYWIYVNNKSKKINTEYISFVNIGLQLIVFNTTNEFLIRKISDASNVVWIKQPIDVHSYTPEKLQEKIRQLTTFV